MMKEEEEDVSLFNTVKKMTKRYRFNETEYEMKKYRCVIR